MALVAALGLAGCDPAPFGNPFGGASGGGSAGSDDAGYTILLYVLNDPATHVRDADRYQKALSGTVGWKGVFAVHKAGHSELFWGRYRSPTKAGKDLQTAKAYRTKDGLPLFAKAMIVPLPGKDIGPSQWDLKNVQADYSLLVATFRDDPERNYVGRQRFAIEYCRRLRKHGYESYFYHGKVISHVTIGAFGKGSVRLVKTPTGQKPQVLDLRVKAIQKDFPMLAVNGTGVNDILRDPRTGKMIRIPRKTYLIRVPKGKAADAR